MTRNRAFNAAVLIWVLALAVMAMLAGCDLPHGPSRSVDAPWLYVDQSGHYWVETSYGLEPVATVDAGQVVTQRECGDKAHADRMAAAHAKPPHE